ncbi:MAG: Piwi domain-containing protein [Candidatus Hodarchaeota archaeon]
MMKTYLENLIFQLQINPKFNAPYYKIKRQFLGKGIPTQGLLASNLRRRGPYLNNVACGVYAKCQGRPWSIKGKISKKFKGLTIYMGFDVSRKQYGRAKHASPGCIVVYDENGQYIYHFTENVPISYEYMDEDVSQNLIETTVARVKAKKGVEPNNIVFMRDGDINDSEILGFKKGIREKGINLFILEIRKAGNIPILKKISEEYTLADSGTYISIENNDELRKLDIFIQTLGPEMNLPTIPKAVKVSPRFLAGKEISINNAELMEDLARQILILSHLNWSGLRGRTKLPITIHFAHEAALLMESGITPQNIDSMALWML